MLSKRTRDEDLLVEYIPESENSLPTADTWSENKGIENTEDEAIYEMIPEGVEDSAATNRKRILQNCSSPDQNQKHQNDVSVIGLFEKELAKEAEKKRNTVEKAWRRVKTAVKQEQSSIELVFCFCRILLLIFITAALVFLIMMKMPEQAVDYKVVNE